MADETYDQFFDRYLQDREKLRVKFKRNYWDLGTNRTIPQGTEGSATFDSTRPTYGRCFMVRVTGQTWGEGWVLTPEVHLEFFQ